MLFKPRAQKLIEALDNSCRGPTVKPRDFQRYKELHEKAANWCAKHPDEFIPFLNDEMANTMGGWMSGSGDKGVSLLRGLIQDHGSPQRHAALRALWEFEEAAASEVPLLTELLRDPDPRIRGSAAHCLGRIGPAALSAGVELAELAQYGGEDEKRSAFFALERTGYDPAIVAQICYDAIQSGSERARDSALSTLRHIDGDSNPVLEKILRVLEESDGRSLESAAIDLIEKGDLRDETLRRRVIQAFESFVAKDPPNRGKSLAILWRLDPGNAVVYQQVENDLRSGEGEMEAACDVICEMKEGGARFVPLLVEQLEKYWDYWDFCWAAVDALGEMGPGAKSGILILEKLRTHPSDLVQDRARWALEKIRR